MAVRRALQAALLLTACLLSFGCDADQVLHYEGQPGTATALDLDAWVPSVASRIDGAADQLVLLDTGAPLTLLFADVIGRQQPLVGQGEADLELLGLRVPRMPVVLMQAGANDGPCVGRQRAGLVGHSLLGHFRLGLDYRQRVAYLFDGPAELDPPYGAATSAPAHIAVELLGGGALRTSPDELVSIGATRVVMPVSLEGLEQHAMLDTGASLTVLSETALQRLQGSDRPQLCCLRVQTLQGISRARLVRLRELRVGAVVVPDLEVIVLDRTLFDQLGAEVGRPLNVLIGGSLLRRFEMRLDYAGRRLALARYESMQHIPADEWLLPGFTFCKARLADQGMVVMDVFDDTDAARQGIITGERLLAVDGVALADLDVDQTLALMRERSVGAPMQLTFRDDGAPAGTREREVVLEQLLPSY